MEIGKFEANKKRRHKIYRLENGTIEVYSFEPIITQRCIFRRHEMQKIDENERMIIKDSEFSFFRPKNVVFECSGYKLRLNPPKDFDEKEAHYALVNRYTKGSFNNGSMHIVDREDIPGKKLYCLDPNEPDVDNYLQVTRNLYLAFLLENEYFTAEDLQDESLEDEKGIFSISSEPVYQLSFEQLETVLKSGLTDIIVYNDEEEERVKRELEQSTKVFEKLR